MPDAISANALSTLTEALAEVSMKSTFMLFAISYHTIFALLQRYKALLVCNLVLPRLLAFVPHQQHLNVGIGVFPDLFHPIIKCVETVPVGHTVDQNNAFGS